MSSVDTLSYFGYKFQVKVITSLLTDRIFLQRVSDILHPGYFENKANEWIVKQIIAYGNEYKACPTLEVLKVRMAELQGDDLLRSEVVEHLKDAWQSTVSDDLPFIKEKVIEFCRNQEIKKAILSSADYLKNGDYDNIKVIIDKAMKVGLDNDIGHDFNEEIDIRYTDSVRDVRATPWDILNELMGGGLGKGELGVFVAPPGIGKSWCLINIGAYAIQHGLNVLHYTLELGAAYVGLRYDSVLTGIVNQNLKYHLDEIKGTIGKLTGKLILKYYPSRTVSVNGLKAHIEKCIMSGFKPDLIIVDYGDLLRGSDGRNTDEKRYAELETIYEDLRGMAGIYDCPVWTASQSTRSSLEVKIIEADKIASSFAKVMVADFVMSLSRGVTDKMSGTGRYHVIKNRFGPDGITLPSKINTANGQIQIFADTTPDGISAQKEMDGGNKQIKSLLKRKYAEIEGKDFE